MKKYLSLFLLLAFLLPAWTGRDFLWKRKDLAAYKNLLVTLQKAQYAKDRLLVKILPAFRRLGDEIIRSHGLEKAGELEGLGWVVVKVPEGSTVREKALELFSDPRVAAVEPDLVYKALDVQPNDEFFFLQWYLRNDGTFGNGSRAGADIEATKGWEYEKGSEAIIIAIVDTGVDYTHPDLEGKVIKGYDYVNDDDDPMDDHGHGTAMAGIAAAKTNNEKGIAGVCWNCKIMAIKALDAQGVGFTTNIAYGIRYAIKHGAKVINLSLGSAYPSQALLDAIEEAYNSNVLVVAAAGNSGASVFYPAAYSPKCISVGATDYNDQRPSFSNYGSSLDVVAPGVMIATTWPTWDQYQYVYISGTSASAAVVSGIAGVLFSRKPSLTIQDARKAILYTCEDINKDRFPGKDVYMGYGRVNLYQLLKPIKLE